MPAKAKLPDEASHGYAMWRLLTSDPIRENWCWAPDLPDHIYAPRAIAALLEDSFGAGPPTGAALDAFQQELLTALRGGLLETVVFDGSAHLRCVAPHEWRRPSATPTFCSAMPPQMRRCWRQLQTAAMSC